MFSVDQVVQATGDSREQIAAYWPLVVAAMRQRGIYSHACQIAVIATVAVECDWATLVEEEDCSYLEGRADLGNTQSGDGCRYKGRGFVQVTGRANYAHYGALLGIDLVAHPERAAEPAIAAQTLCRYFQEHDIPAMARRGDWHTVRVAVNGGLNGIERFLGIVNALSDMAEPADQQQGGSMATWQPTEHVSQWMTWPDGSVNGANNCGFACLLRYLHERGQRPFANLSVPDALGELRRIATGVGNRQYQGGCGTAELLTVLRHYGVVGDAGQTYWTDDWATAQAAQISIVLVDHAPVRADTGDPDFPPSFLGGEQHWLVWLPALDGRANRLNDPLAWPQQVDTSIVISSLAAGFVGALILAPLPGIGTTQPAPKPAPHPGPQRRKIGNACALKPTPDHTSKAVANLPSGGQVLDTWQRRSINGEVWGYITWSGRWGWVPADRIVDL